VSGGWTRQIGRSSFDTQSATSLGFSYGYRLHKNIEAETGLHLALDPTGDVCSRFGCTDAGDRYYWVPFGLRFIAPLYGGRVELGVGGGGLWEKYTSTSLGTNATPYERHGWGGYFVGSAAVALDHSRHFWLGAAPRWFLANPRYARDRWFQVTGEFGFRF
jgi:hypothetical protein